MEKHDLTGTQKERSKQKRALILEAMSKYLQENPNCELCGDTAVEVHHIISRIHLPTADDPENFISVCRKHHIWIEQNFLEFVVWFGEEKYNKLFKKSRGIE